MPDESEVDAREQERRDARWRRLQERPAGVMTGPFAEILSAIAPAQKHAFQQQQTDKIAPAPQHNDESFDVDLDNNRITLRPKKKA